MDRVLLDNPEATNQELMKLLKGRIFPTVELSAQGRVADAI